MASGAPEALSFAGFDRLELAVREGRLEDFRIDAEKFEQDLDLAAIRRRLEQNPTEARALLDRLAGLEAVLGYTAAVTQALGAIGVQAPEAYGPDARATAESPARTRPTRLQVEA